MASWYKTASNASLVLGTIAALLAIVSALGWLDRPALSADPPVIDLGEIAPGTTLPLKFTLRNHTGEPVRLVGASFEP
jgi:hypothetical protein